MSQLYRCTECDRTFAGKKGLKKHTAKAHAQQYICPICTRDFPTAAQLEVHTGYADAAPGEKIIQPHYCSGGGCGKMFCSRQACNMHESTCKYRPEDSKTADKCGAHEKAAKTEHHELFRTALETNPDRVFVPTLKYSKKNYPKKEKKKKYKSTREATGASNGIHKSAYKTDASISQDTNTPTINGRVVDLDDQADIIANDPRYALCRWENCGYCGRCMEDNPPGLYYQPYYAHW